MRKEALDAVGQNGESLRVEFVWRGDRYGHVIYVADAAGQLQLLLESVEGTPEDAWPPSPPLQSLHRETLPDGRQALLLVGAAGRGHWSASVEASAGSAALTFDFACRHGGDRGWLGCRYRALPGSSSLLSLDTTAATAAWRDGSLEFSALLGSPTTRWKFTIGGRLTLR
jgi:hypothetical protein